MMKNKVFAILTVVVLCLAMLLPVSAAGTHIFDDTQMIGNISELEAYAQQIEDNYGYSVLLSVVDGVGDKGTLGYCEDLYNANAADENGIALTYNYGDNKYAFYCAGEAETLFTTDIQNNVLWYAFAYTETYYEGAYAYLAAVEEIIKKAPTATDPVTDAPEAESTTEFVPVDRTLSLVEDYADVLTDTEEAELLSKLEALGAANDIEIGVVTVDSNEGKTPEAFADDFYDYNGYGYGENDDGFIVVFNTGEGDGNRNLWISTHGKGIDLLTDMEIDVIIEMMITPIKNGDFAGAFDNFVSECENAVDTSVSLLAIPLAIAIGFGLAFLIVKIQASKLKTVVQKADAADYVGNVVLTYQNDQFMYRNVVRSPKMKSDSSSTHTSSSGRTHGGGGRSF
ncbi:MAG: TPM domain-containing protein [Clostridia bacterium]|nr:TPM domain-containing protein [Clostridia bacterium]